MYKKNDYRNNTVNNIHLYLGKKNKEVNPQRV